MIRSGAGRDSDMAAKLGGGLRAGEGLVLAARG
jgi:hypothetical protein